MFISGLGNVPPLVVVDDSHGYVCRTTFSAPELLDPAKRPADPEQRARVLADGLVFLSACQARIELRIGHGLKRLMGAELGGPRKLGIPRAVDACQAVCGFSWSFGRQLRRMHERLEELRFLRAAFNSGRVPRTKIRAVLAVATRETDGAWAQLAKKHSVEWLQAAANATRKSGAMPAPEPHPDDAAPETVTLSWMTSAPHALAFTYWGREMLKTVVGAEASDGTLLQALVQELESDAQVPPEDDEPAAGSARPRPGVAAPFARAGTLARLRERSRRQHQRDLRDGVAGTRVDLELRRLRIHLPHVTDHGSVGSLAECLKTLACLRRRIEWERSRLLAGLAKDDVWEKLSYPSWPQFLQHALGLSQKDAANLLALEGAVAEMPPLGDALRDGRLSARTVRMIASVARPDTAADWTTHAIAATPKRLATEVPFHLMLRQTRPEREYLDLTAGGRPVAELTVPDMAARWREVFGTQEEVARASKKSRRARVEQARAAVGVVGLPAPGTPPPATPGAEAPGHVEHPVVPGIDVRERLRAAVLGSDALAQVRAQLNQLGLVSPLRRRLVRVTVRVPADVAEHFMSMLRRVRQLHHYLLDDGQCVVWMLLRFAAVWAKPEIAALHQQYAIFERDGWQCASPHCTARRHLEAHHTEFRSHCGSDDAWNLSARCYGCHRSAIHDGFMRVSGRAPADMVQVLGLGHWKEAYRNELRIPLPR